MSIFNDIKRVINAVTNTAVVVAESAEKTVLLYDKEVDNLHQLQDLRLAEGEAELAETRKRLGLV
ncbi:hypothetical protein HN803_02395 [candidate division WWE3 bacterium]|nr:hypothetical protein [candidate division WWE3 bacterium]